MNEQTGRLRQVQPCAVLQTILLLCSLMAFARQAEALSILSIRDFSQSAGASYAFHQSKTSAAVNSRESGHEFTEDYSTSFNYSLLSPQLLKGNAMLDLEWLQNSADSDGSTRKNSDFQLRYNIYSQVLSRKPYPMIFSASSSRQTISQSFAPSYDNQTDALTAQLSILNLFVPASFAFNQQTQESSGLNQNFRQKVDTFSIDASPKLGRMGSLTLGANHTESDSAALESNLTSHNASASARAGYHVDWKSEQGLSRNLSLASAYNATAGVTTLNNQNLNGNLHWQFGNALDGSIDCYSSKSSSSLSVTESRGAGASLSHRLLDTLTTGLHLSTSDDRFDTGVNRSYTGGVSLGYGKLLPEASSLDLGYSYNLILNERSGNVSVIEVINEAHPIPADTIQRRITLAQPTFLPASIKVVSAQTFLPYPSSNFTVVAEGIELNTIFAGDTAVLVSYSYRQDPSVTTLSSSQGISASLNLYQGKYRLYADAKMSDNNLVHGEATQLTLTNTRHYDAGATAHLSRHTLGAEVGYDKNYAEDLYYLATTWGYAAPYAGGDLTVHANDHYSWQSTQESRAAIWMNSFSLLGEYRRPIGFLAGIFKANYANTLIEGGGAAHTAVIGVNLEGKFGKLLALLTSTATWNFSSNAKSSSQAVGVSIRRMF